MEKKNNKYYLVISIVCFLISTIVFSLVNSCILSQYHISPAWGIEYLAVDGGLNVKYGFLYFGTHTHYILVIVLINVLFFLPLIVGIIFLIKTMKHSNKVEKIVNLTSIGFLVLFNVSFHTLTLLHRDEAHKYYQSFNQVKIELPNADNTLIPFIELPIESYEQKDPTEVNFNIIDKYKNKMSLPCNDDIKFKGHTEKAYVLEKKYANEDCSSQYDGFFEVIKHSDTNYTFTFSKTYIHYNSKNYFIITPPLSIESINNHEEFTSEDAFKLKKYKLDNHLYTINANNEIINEDNLYYLIDNNELSIHTI